MDVDSELPKLETKLLENDFILLFQIKLWERPCFHKAGYVSISVRSKKLN